MVLSSVSTLVYGLGTREVGNLAILVSSNSATEVRDFQLVEQLSGIEIGFPLALDNTQCYSSCVCSVWDP